MVACSNAGNHTTHSMGHEKNKGLRRLSIGFLWPGNLLGPTIPWSFEFGMETARQILPEFEIATLIRNTNCSPKQGMKDALELRRSLGTLDGIIGPGCSVVCEPVGLLSAALNIPSVTNYCSSAYLSDKRTYPTFLRPRGTQDGYMDGMIAMLHMFNWTRMSIICDTAPIFKYTGEQIKGRFEDNGITVHFYTLKSTVVGGKLVKKNFEIMRKIIMEVKKITRVTLLFMYTFDVRHLLILAEKEGLMTGEHLFFGTDQVHFGTMGARYAEPQLEDSEVYHGVITFVSAYTSGSVLDEFFSKAMDTALKNNVSADDLGASLQRDKLIAGK